MSAEQQSNREYDFRSIEQKWQQQWAQSGAYKVPNPPSMDKPKYYVLDMFPYPSGAGLHVGHPLGYIASDIYARYKRLKGFNVLHPMGYDAFGLPAEQYAIEHGVHPAVSTAKNISTFRSQLDKIGFCFDWDREVNTSDPQYYKWTQWIFLQLFNSWYNRQTNKTEKIETLLAIFQREGNVNHPVPASNFQIPSTNNQRSTNNFTADEWKGFDEKTQQTILMEYRIAYCGYGEVNWCEALGTVLANDEVVNGVSERGGYPVVKKKLRQWYLRITEYADRLLQGLQTVDFSDAMKEMQSNWIGKSSGAEINFKIQNSPARIVAYTTRPDTIFGVDFMVLAPEHDLVSSITTSEQKAAVDEYIAYVKSRSERERMAEKKISGVFTGAYVEHPFTGLPIPVWTSEYVLAGYGTGAIMAVPSGDERDLRFAQHFGIPVTNIWGDAFNGEEAVTDKNLPLQNSDFVTGMKYKEASEAVINKLVEEGTGVRKTNYKMRDAAFSRQRYWGEPFPIKWIDGVAYALDESELPLQLPHVDKYGPGPEGEGPLANIDTWKYKEVKLQQSESLSLSPLGGEGAGALETNTMPGYAGSSWYFLRYMDPHNDQTFADKNITSYWNQVDLYVGGTEHAVGHLLYSRMWTKALYDLGYISFDEPFKKLLNQGMIQGESAFANFIGFTFSAVGHAEFNEEDQRNYQYLIEKYKAVQNRFISEDLMTYIRKSYLKPSTEEERRHQEIRDNLGSRLLTPVYEEIKQLGLEKKVITAPFINYYKIHVPINCVNYKDELDVDLLQSTDKRFVNAEFIGLQDKFICRREVEKMSKSKYNVVNPDDIINDYGADTFRMYEMFLGPVEVSKPWDTKGIEGVHRFLKKLWRLFYADAGFAVVDEQPTDAEYKVLHKTIKKIEEDTERFSFNTCVSAFMVCVNELTDLKCRKKDILEPLLILLTPYAPHIAEELYQQVKGSLPVGEGRGGASILDANFPQWDEKYLVESNKEYPVSVNGKLRTTLNFSLTATKEEVEPVVLQNEIVQKWLEGKPPKKIIFVPNKMINIVV